MKRSLNKHIRLGAFLLFCGSMPPMEAQEPTPPPAPTPPALTTGAPAGAAPNAEVRLLSIDAAVQEALRKNPSLESTAAAVRRAEGVLAEARSFLLPRLDANARFAVQGPIPS